MKYKNLFLLAGHGLSSSGKKDPGAVAGDGTTEREIAVSIAEYAMKEFNEWNYSFMSTTGVFNDYSLTKKINEINSYCNENNLDHKNSLLIEIHCDWSGANEGASGYYYNGSDEGKKFADTVIGKVAEVGSRKLLWVRGDNENRYGQLGIIHDTKPLAILVEAGSLKADSNDQDGLELLRSTQGQKDIARKIFEGVLEYMGEEIPNKNTMTIIDEKTVEMLIAINSLKWHETESEELKEALQKCNETLRELV